MLMLQDIGFILVKDLTQSQEGNLEEKSESVEVRVKGSWGAEKGFRAGRKSGCQEAPQPEGLRGWFSAGLR